MAEEKNKDLTTEELLKKLMENFGAEDTSEPGTQMTIDETAAEQNKKKVYRYRKDVPAEEQTVEPDGDELSAILAQSIANAEKYVESMDGGRDGEEETAETSETAETEETAETAETEEPEESAEIKEAEEPSVWTVDAIADAVLPEKPEETAEPKEPEEKTDSEASAEADEKDEKDENGETKEDETDPMLLFAAIPDFTDEEPAPATEEPIPEEEKPEEPENEALEEAPEETPGEAPKETTEDVSEEESTSDLSALLAVLASSDWTNDDRRKEEEKKNWEELLESTSETEETEDESGELPALLSAVLEEEADGENGAAVAEEPTEEENPDELSDDAEPVDERDETDDGVEPTDEKDGTDAEEETSEEPFVPEQSDLFGDEEPVTLHEKEPAKEPAATEAEEDEIDENEAHLMMIFGMDKDLEKKIGKKKVEKMRREIDGDAGAETVAEEYESPEQNEKFFAKYRKAYNLLTARIVLALLMLIPVILLELIPAITGGARGGMFGASATAFLANPVNAALIAMQITVLLAAVGYKEFFGGLKAIGTGRSSPEVFLSLTVILSLIYEGGLLYCHSTKAQFYNLPVALCVLTALLFSRMNLKRNLMAFKIVSSKKTKFAIASRTDKESVLEKEAFADCVSESSGIYGIEKTKFVSGFAGRSAREPKFKSITGILAAAVVVIGLIFFLLGYYFSGGQTGNLRLLSAFTMSVLAVLFCMPLSAFITYSLPFFKASKKAFDLDSAIIGEYSLEEYSDATVISFDDKEIFPAKGVKVRSLKLFGDSRIDHVLFGAASVFRKLGGPLDEVFTVATRETGVTDDVDILEIEKNGVETAVKGIRVYIGSSGFMRERGLLSEVNAEDEVLEMEGRISIMYLAIGGELAAKMYVEYNADPEIKGIMEALYKAGMCIGIRTLDPNIDDRMMRSHVDLSKYPVKVLRREKAADDTTEEKMSAGVVSKKSVKNLLKTLTFCRKVLQVIKANSVVKVFGIVIGIAVSVLLLVLGSTGRLVGIYTVNSLWTTLYQLCWMAFAAVIALIFA